ncbi:MULTISPECIES: EAL domain-containing protein [Corallococcus]|uniref:EAL domain-containing protein n=1 Tax=Corallococcus TaxID=83461 RepID=UPI00117C50F3|nr:MULTISPECIES: EAL domain-containing protein [Corallococcus]NBD08656.1 EAL domain-containing protein [Corallococcus silvisoli]TSC32627.1 EAL domain-containing protein [Corallococcus sp. Z5C101001]
MTPPNGCGRCQTLPGTPDEPGRLFLWPPLGHSLGKLVAHLRESGGSYQLRADAQCVVVGMGQGGLRQLSAHLPNVLTAEEVRGTRALFVPGDSEPGMADFPRVDSLQRLTTLQQSGWLVDMLAEGRLTTFFQPIVHAQDTSHIFAHEGLLRGRDAGGALVPPNRLFDTAREADLLFQLDLAARTTAIREAVRHQLRTHLFINFTPTAIYDPAHCLRSTVAAIREAGIPESHVVFEIIESDRAANAAHLRAIVDFYRQAGFKVALDDLGAGYSSLNLIHQLRPEFMKLDMELVRGVHADPYKASIVQKLLEIARQLGIQTVAEGIETPEELSWVRRHGVDFVQGYLIARPSDVPARSTPRITD